jgi:predicted O-linked N-acetylglucosamine transferase (SPINDLY family)
MRGRQSAAMLRQVGAEGLIAKDANDYVAIASRLTDDPAWRERVARTIRDGLGAMFDRQEPVRAFGELLLQGA